MLLLLLGLFCTKDGMAQLDRTKEILKHFPEKYNLNYVLVLKHGNTNDMDEILKAIEVPKLIIDSHDDLNYLNCPKYYSQSNGNKLPIKYCFNSEFMVLTFLTKGSIYHLFNFMTDQSKDQISIFLAEEELMTKNHSISFLEFLYEKDYLNILYFNTKYIQKDRRFLTFQRFPKPKLISTDILDRKSVSNIKGNSLKIKCLRKPYFSVCKEKNKKIFGYGKIFNIAKSFGEFLNANVKIVLSSAHSADIDNYLKIYSNTALIAGYPKIWEFVSPLETSQVQISIPKSRPINTKLYLIAPVSWKVIIFIISYVIYGSFIISLTFHIIKRKRDSWKIIDELIRSSLSQSFPWSKSGIQSSVIYFLCLILGFILTVWYLAILGSYITTNLYEKQVKTLNDMREAGMKYIYEKHYGLEGLINFNESSDLAKIVTYEEFKTIKDSQDPRFALVINSNPYVSRLFTDYILSDFIFEENFLMFDWKQSSGLYKAAFDRYIHLVKDTGLYNYWQLNYDLYRENILFIVLKNQDPNILRILDLNFFFYPFLGMIAGMFISCVFFGFEYSGLKYFHKITKCF